MLASAHFSKEQLPRGFGLSRVNQSASPLPGCANCSAWSAVAFFLAPTATELSFTGPGELSHHRLDADAASSPPRLL